MPVSRCGTRLTSISMPLPPRGAHLARRARQAGSAHVLNADDRVGLHQLEARLEQQLLHERIADLHVGTLLGRLLVELRRRHGRAVDAVAAGLRADVDDGIPGARGLPMTSASAFADPEAEHVDERVAGVAVVEHDLAADGRDADAVAVAGDAGAPRLRRCAGCARRRDRRASRSGASSSPRSAARPS